MKIKKYRVGYELPIYLMLIGMMLVQIANPLKLDFIVSLGTWMIVFATVVSLIFTLIEMKINDKRLWGVVLIGVSVVLSMLFSEALEYKDVVYALSFLEIPLLMFCFCVRKDVDSVIEKAIHVCFFVLAIYYLGLSFTSISNVYYDEHGFKSEEFLTLGYNNPNETAMHLIVCFFVLFDLYVKLTKRTKKLIVLLAVLSITRLIVMTMSRTAALVLLVFVGILVISKGKMVQTWIKRVCFVIPIAFVLLTFALDLFEKDISIFGESIETGRLQLYNTVFKSMNLKTFLFGNYQFGFKNLHNGYLSIFATIGIIGTVIFIFYWYKHINDLFWDVSYVKFNSKIPIISLLCLFVYCSTEAAFLTSGGSYAASVVSLYLLATFNKRTDESPVPVVS